MITNLTPSPRQPALVSCCGRSILMKAGRSQGLNLHLLYKTKHKSEGRNIVTPHHTYSTYQF